MDTPQVATIATGGDQVSESIDEIKRQRDVAIQHLAEWCVAIERNGSGWDDWDEFYKDAAYRPASLPEIRKLLGRAIEEERARWVTDEPQEGTK
jgi:hypothetical protein